MSGPDLNWGADLPRNHSAVSAGLAHARSALGALADLLATLEEHDGATEARAIAAAVEPLLNRASALGPRVVELTPRLAERNIAENKRKNDERIAREKADNLALFARMK